MRQGHAGPCGLWGGVWVFIPDKTEAARGSPPSPMHVYGAATVYPSAFVSALVGCHLWGHTQLDTTEVT